MGDDEPGSDQRAFLARVALPGDAGGVVPGSVEFDDEARVRPVAVDLEGSTRCADPLVGDRHGQPVAVEEAKKAILELTARRRGPAVAHRENAPEGEGAAPVRALIKGGSQAARVAAALDLRLVNRTLELHLISLSCEIDQGPGRHRDRNPVESDDLIGRHRGVVEADPGWVAQAARDDHVYGCTIIGGEAQTGCSTPSEQCCALAAGEYGRHPAGPDTDTAVPDGVDASMQPVQQAAPHAGVSGAGADPQFAQLSRGHDAVLAPCKPGQAQVPVSRRRLFTCRVHNDELDDEGDVGDRPSRWRMRVCRGVTFPQRNRAVSGAR